MKVCLGLWCLLSLLLAARSAREQDLVEFLPGLDEQPSFRHYAGHLNAGGGKQLFYWFIESERSPADDPLVLWLNGGPGCSSLTGLLVELGPWRVNENGTKLEWFEQRWTKIANIIFLESPAGVGFSYDENDDYVGGDDASAFYNREALRDFFEGFPEFADHDFYVTGESYAGVYVPTLSSLLIDEPERFKFKGMAIGNGVTDREIMSNGLVYYAFARGVYGTALRDELLHFCCVDGNSTNCNFHDNPDVQCQLKVARVNFLVWRAGINPYNLYQACDGGVPDADASFHPDLLPIAGLRNYENQLQKFRASAEKSGTRESKVPCTDATNRKTWLNSPEVRQALHIPEHVHEWVFCSSWVSGNYSREYTRMQQQYNKVLDAGFRVLVFNGDLDMACDHLSDMWFVEQLDRPLVKDYTKWFFEDADGTRQVAGYVSQYERIDYVTVKGAGHFVPTDQPLMAYEMWQKFLSNQSFTDD